jgi:hypothetical protein
MRTMVAAGLFALVPVALAGAGPSIPQTPPAVPKPVPAPSPTPTPVPVTKPSAGKPPAAKPAGAAKPAPAAAPQPAASPMEAPKLPPFAGEIVNFDRHGNRVVACVDAAKVKAPPRMGPDGKPVAPAAPTPAPDAPPRLRIWVIEREVMQELMTTSGLCDPVWSPDGKTFAASGVRGVFMFTEPNFEPRVLVAGQLQAPPPGAPPAREYDDPAWSPSGTRLAFRSAANGAGRVEVVDVKSAEVLLKREGAAKALRWADEKTLVIDGTRVPVP